jgi:hypothetical protein
VPALNHTSVERRFGLRRRKNAAHRSALWLLKSHLCGFINSFNAGGKDQAKTREEIPWLQLHLR